MVLDWFGDCGTNGGSVNNDIREEGGGKSGEEKVVTEHDLMRLI